MAHPFNSIRADKVQHARVGKITKACGGGMMSSGGVADRVKGYATGGAVKETQRADGGAVKSRADRPNRARGGRTGKKRGTKGHTVNVIVAPSSAPKPAMVPGVAAAPPPPPAPRPMAPPPVPPGPGPSGAGGPPLSNGPLPPGVPPMRAKGGKVPLPKPDPRTPREPQPGDLYEPDQVKQLERKKGGAVFSGSPSKVSVNAKTKSSGVAARDYTPVQHASNKDNMENIGRGPVITKATGGPIYSKPKGQMGPKFNAGARGGDARLQKAKKLAGAGYGRPTVSAVNPTRNPVK